MSGPNLITIDGPSASGKSSVSREVARHLGWTWVSTGVFYRGLAFVADQNHISPTDEPALLNLLHDKSWRVEMNSEKTLFLFKNEDVTEKLKQEEVGALASQISTLPKLRESLLQPQRDCLKVAKNGLVAEGRDCGTVVFPQAPLKIYLTAKSSDRARRRAAEMGKTIKETKAFVSVRDKSDQNREFAPLQVAEGSEKIDTTGLTLEEVIKRVLSLASLKFS